MRNLLVLSVVGCLTAPQIAAASTILVSCFRGPTEEVIWDRANTQFIDSLVGVGYSYATALALGERLCRDQSLVGRPEAMKAEMQKLIRITPKDGPGQVRK